MLWTCHATSLVRERSEFTHWQAWLGSPLLLVRPGAEPLLMQSGVWRHLLCHQGGGRMIIRLGQVWPEAAQIITHRLAPRPIIRLSFRRDPPFDIHCPLNHFPCGRSISPQSPRCPEPWCSGVVQSSNKCAPIGTLAALIFFPQGFLVLRALQKKSKKASGIA